MDMGHSGPGECTLLVGERIIKSYEGREVLREVNAELSPGITGLLGPNGAGKTTLLEILSTVLPANGGHVSINGVPIESESAARRARKQIGYLPQSFPFDPKVKVRDFVMYAAWCRGLSQRTWKAAVDRALNATDLKPHAQKRLGKLSGGTRQRAGIAWAIVGEPEFVLLDEPTVGLDPEQRIRFREIIGRLEHTSVLLSTHLTDDVEAICDRVIILSAGSNVFTGTLDAVRSHAERNARGNTKLERAYIALIKGDRSDSSE